MEKISAKEYLSQICECLDASAMAYRQYLAGGKTFRYAKELKKYNGEVTTLLDNAALYLDESLQKDAAALLHHYHAWTTKWEALAASANPSDDDEFVFANDITFPRQAALNLEAELEKLISN